MQALRIASFTNRPTLLAIQTLVMIGPYLTDSGKFLDAWALFGVTIRLAQAIGRKFHPDDHERSDAHGYQYIETRSNGECRPLEKK